LNEAFRDLLIEISMRILIHRKYLMVRWTEHILHIGEVLYMMGSATDEPDHVWVLNKFFGFEPLDLSLVFIFLE
jgi:hypothetical protein